MILPARSSSSEFLRDKPSPARSFERTSSTCLGSSPHRDVTRTRPLTAGLPTSPLRSVLGLSQPLDGLLRAPACRLISSRCRVQDFARSGCSPLAQPPSLIGRSLPPCRHSSRADRPKSAATPDALGFEASIRARMRAPGSVIHRTVRRSPPRVSSPPGAPFSRRAARLTRSAPSSMLPPASFACALAACGHPRRLPTRNSVYSSPNYRPAEFSNLPISRSKILANPKTLD